MKKKNLLTRVIIIAIVTVVGIYLVIGPRRRPNLKDFTWSGIKQSLRSNIHLGLDLQGGSHLVMRVKTEEYLKRLTEESYTAAQNAAKDAGFEVKGGQADTASGNYRILLQLADPSKAAEVKNAVEKKVELGDTNVWSYSPSGDQISWTMTQAAQRTLADNATTQALNIIDSRINALGITEPTLQTHGAQSSHQILLQMPGVQDPERVKNILQGESRLELVHVIGPPNPAPATTYPTEMEAIASLNSGVAIPPNRKVLPYQERIEKSADGKTDPTQQKPKQWVAVENPPIIDGSELRNAAAIPSQGGRADDYEINFSLKKTGAEKFGAWTGAHINEYMGVVLNNEVKSIAFIKSQIFDSGQISGRFTKQSAEDLALTLRSGALPAPIEYIEERTVGPSLGQDSINAGVRASLVGLALVVVFMLFYYRGSGVNAVVALVLNMILMLAGLIVFGATLTLPGIAGMILTIGMAVDSNVLIFERIREELRSGKTVPSAVDLGFDRAFITIIDTHVTTIISSLFLFVFGTGPIRGFAVTLVIGLLVNLFSAVYVSRTIFIWLLSRRKMESLSI
ncbi:MAG TPA: protein translocase subunit SecD [Pyrinomonadaceae bacterium]|jgi:preprotein translocase subunit SecD|nr:protein translocase subunit SecD [Pyrinomonadaceae bacterium]